MTKPTAFGPYETEDPERIVEAYRRLIAQGRRDLDSIDPQEVRNTGALLEKLGWQRHGRVGQTALPDYRPPRTRATEYHPLEGPEVLTRRPATDLIPGETIVRKGGGSRPKPPTVQPPMTPWTGTPLVVGQRNVAASTQSTAPPAAMSPQLRRDIAAMAAARRAAPQVPDEIALPSGLQAQARQAQSVGDRYRAGNLPGVARPDQAQPVQGGMVFPAGTVPPPNPDTASAPAVQAPASGRAATSPVANPPPTPGGAVPPLPEWMGSPDMAALQQPMAQGMPAGATPTSGGMTAPVPSYEASGTAPDVPGQLTDAQRGEREAARGLDTGLGILGAIGDALRAYGGLPPAPTRRREADVIARQERGMARDERAAAREDAAKRAGLTAETAQRRADQQAELTRRRLDLMDTSIRGLNAQRAASAEAMGRRAETGAAAQEQRAIDSATSGPAWESARIAASAAVRAIRPGPRRDEAMAALRPLLRNGTVHDLRAFAQNAPRYLRDVTGRHRQRGGGGRGRAPGGGDQLADELVREHVQLGGTEAQARGMLAGRNGLRALAAANQRMRGGRETEARQLGTALDAVVTRHRRAQNQRRIIDGASDAEIQTALAVGSSPTAIRAAAALRGLDAGRITRVRGAVLAMQGELLRERSGTAASDREFDRIRGEVGALPTSNPAQVREYARRLDHEFGVSRRRIRARFSDQARAEYDRRLRNVSGSRSRQRSATRRLRIDDGSGRTILDTPRNREIIRRHGGRVTADGRVVSR